MPTPRSRIREPGGTHRSTSTCLGGSQATSRIVRPDERRRVEDREVVGSLHRWLSFERRRGRCTTLRPRAPRWNTAEWAPDATARTRASIGVGIESETRPAQSVAVSTSDAMVEQECRVVLECDERLLGCHRPIAVRVGEQPGRTPVNSSSQRCASVTCLVATRRRTGRGTGGPTCGCRAPCPTPTTSPVDPVGRVAGDGVAHEFNRLRYCISTHPVGHLFQLRHERQRRIGVRSDRRSRGRAIRRVRWRPTRRARRSSTNSGHTNITAGTRCFTKPGAPARQSKHDRRRT